MEPKTIRIVYWFATLLFVVPQIWSAVQMLTEAPRMAATLHHLGYPDYFMIGLGVAKVLGAAAIVLGFSRGLKEWAYAGYTFDTVGAFVSHLSRGDSLGICAVPLAFLLVQLLSYALWKRLGSPRLLAAASTRSGHEPHVHHQPVIAQRPL